MSKKSLISLLVVYVVSAVATFTVFAAAKPSLHNAGNQSADTVSDRETALGALLDIDPSEPRDQACPLNGKLYTNTERAAWEKRRPIAIMIENSPDARPQSGLSSADVVFEAIAEGGVTRFMALMYCGAQAYDVTMAPVRSARVYFVEYAAGFNYPLYTHVGGANLPGPTNALGLISELGWSLRNNINQFSVGYPTFVRNANRLNRPVATEHTMETTTELLWEVAAERDWTNMSEEIRIGRTIIPAADWKDGFEPWTFEDTSEDGDVRFISYEFWSGYDQYAVSWTYNPDTNTYARVMGGEEHVDLNNERQIEAANVVVLLTAERGPLNELKHILYTTTGTGDALLFKNGEALQVKWSKPTIDDELRFVDSRGQDVPLARGLTWISVLDDSTEVNY